MTVLHNNGGDPVPQSRHPHGSYRLPIETRAALAVGLIENAGWSLRMQPRPCASTGPT
jgi:hypothetical protein